MAAIPRERTPDSSLALAREGFEFVTNRCRRLASDAFSTRLMLRPVVCMQGAEAARFFTQTPMTRRGAIPRPFFALLQDVGSVAALDGEMHRLRKRMFLDMMSDEGLARLERISDAEWARAAERWRRADRVILLPAAEDLLCRVACDWAGVPRVEPEIGRRAEELAAMVDGAGGIGPRNVRGHVRRRSAERWAAATVRGIRAGRVPAGDPPSPAAAIAGHRDADGRPLDETVAAVELLDLLRPTVATARFIAFAALALHCYPESREAAAGGSAEQETAFVHEVRRFYPFFPAIGAGRWRSRSGAANRCRAGSGSCSTSTEPTATRARGKSRSGSCPSGSPAGRETRIRSCRREQATMKPATAARASGPRSPSCAAPLRALTRAIAYTVPDQDLRIRPSRIPPRPASGFVMQPTGAGSP